MRTQLSSLSDSVFQKLDLHYDVSEVIDLYNDLKLSQFQTYISSPDGQTYNIDASDFRTGKLKESECCTVNKMFRGTIIERIYNDLDIAYGVCRARIMMMDSTRRAYSYHVDFTPRLHIPIQTDDNCMFVVDDKVYRMPDIGHLYYLNTTFKHTALNLGNKERIHLIFSLKDYYDPDCIDRLRSSFYNS